MGEFKYFLEEFGLEMQFNTSVLIGYVLKPDLGGITEGNSCRIQNVNKSSINYTMKTISANISHLRATIYQTRASQNKTF